MSQSSVGRNGARIISVRRIRAIARKASITTFVTVIGLTLSLVAVPAVHAGTADATLAATTNAVRADHGLSAYRTCADLNSVAASWATYMATHGLLTHNPNISSAVANWTSIGENVGAGASVVAIGGAFQHSPPHLQNLLSATFVEVGYGSARSANGKIYVDEVFRRPESPCAAGAPHVTPPAGRPNVGPQRAPAQSHATQRPAVAGAPAVPTPLERSLVAERRLVADQLSPPAGQDALARALAFHVIFANAVA